jgi:hypothetical protein
MIAVDYGRSAIKIVHPTGRVERPPLVARLERPPQAALLESAGAERGAVISLDGTWYAMGEAARGLPQAVYVTDERKATPAARVILAAALTAAGAHRWDRVQVALAIPAGLASSDSWPLARLVAGPLRVMSPLGDTHTVTVDPHVLSEPAAAALSVILDSDGRPDRALLEQSVAVVDAGHRTLDVSVLRRGKLVEGSARSTPTGGLVAFESWTREVLEPIYGLLTDSERAAVMSAAASGCAPIIRGREVPPSVLAQLGNYRQRLAERVLTDLHNTLAAVEYETLIVTGGLAAWLELELREAYPHAHIPLQPRWSVAEGGLRYLKYLSRRRAAEPLAQAATQ